MAWNVSNWSDERLQRGDPNRGTGLYRFGGQSDTEKAIAAEQERRKRAAAAPTPSGGVNVADVMSPFKQAIAALSGAGGDVEKSYQQGKRRTLSDIAMQSVNAGMANTINMPAAGIAYDAENRANTNVAVAGQKANLLGSMGQAMAGVYGTNVGAETSRSNALLGANTSMAESQLGANTSRANANLSYQANQNNNALQKYLGELEMKYRYGGAAGTTGIPPLTL